MISKYSHILMLLSAILAFAPVLAVDYILDGYVRIRETSSIQNLVDELTIETQESVYDGLKSIRTVLEQSPSLCTPTFVRNAQNALRTSLALRQFIVENDDGVQYCDLFGQDLHYVVLSKTLTLPGRPETLTVVQLEGYELPMLKVTRLVGAKHVSAIVYLSPRLTLGLPEGLRTATTFRLSLTNGTPIVTLGDYAEFAERTNDLAFIAVNSFASEIPIRAEIAVPFLDVRAGYADLDWAFTIIACLMSGGFLFLALQYVRREAIPAMDIERAIALGELRPYYQPVIHLGTGKLLGCEVLVRWVKRSGKVVPPSEFIDYAEASGLAIPMTVHLMQQVRNELSGLCREMPEIKISINLFEGHFHDNSIVEDVQAIFGGSSIRFRQLVFEITERRPISNNVQAASVIAGLHAIGARLALDDVGTGHSNLAYMQTLGVDIIKIDQVFVDMVKPDSGQVPVLNGLIAMAVDLGAEIVAEGVETEAQAIYLRDHGVVQAQGYLFAPPLKPEAFLNLARALNFVAPKSEDLGDSAAA
ncbi:MAG: EAL domain-containing protein [Alphaproteobacteria bacterium]|nr:EAL domain-containing protein [Alphaproteobacteria bacterium]